MAQDPAADLSAPMRKRARLNYVEQGLRRRRGNRPAAEEPCPGLLAAKALHGSALAGAADIPTDNIESALAQRV